MGPPAVSSSAPSVSTEATEVGCAGPTPPTWPVQQVGRYLRYTGRDVDGVATAACDPLRKQHPTTGSAGCYARRTSAHRVGQVFVLIGGAEALKPRTRRPFDSVPSMTMNGTVCLELGERNVRQSSPVLVLRGLARPSRPSWPSEVLLRSGRPSRPNRRCLSLTNRSPSGPSRCRKASRR
jgi:hypothetical protein